MIFVLLSLLFFFFLGVYIYYGYNINEILYNDIDKNIYHLGKPIVMNYIMYPLIGMIDTLWMNKFYSTNEITGSDVGDQIFFIIYLLVSFLPSILPSKITELQSNNKDKELKELISISFILTMILGFFSTLILFTFCNSLLQIFITEESIIYENASNYLKYKSISMIPSLINSLIFSVLRGLQDIDYAIKINFKSQILNILINPLFIKYYGLKGYAFSGFITDIYCTINYCNIIYSKNIYTYEINNFFKKSFEMVKNGMSITIKNSLNNIVSIYMNKKILDIDKTGKLLSVNIFLSRFINICFIPFYGLHSVSNILIPQTKNIENNKKIEGRIILLTIITGIIQSVILYNLQFLFPYFTSDLIVINTSKKIIGLISLYQIFFGYYHVYEGILQGYNNFQKISIANLICSIPKLILLYFSKSLENIWTVNILIIILKSFFLYYL